jgi:prepilin-type N-terminal cleavage/methylation domain-containing protein
MNRQGVTLVELLIAASILLVILGIITQGMQSGSRVVTSVISETEILEDTRIAAQMIADGVARAVYVYPPGASITLNQSTTWRVKNSRSNSNTWVIGQDPMVAYLEAPKRPTGTCSDVSETAKESCLYFVAYYALLRSAVTENLSYLQDDSNEEAWVLFEYRRRINLNKLGEDTVLPLGPSSGLIQGVPEMLADYIVPETGFVLSEAICRKRYIEVEIGETSPEICAEFAEDFDPYYLKTLVSGTVTLAAKVKRRTQDSQTPPMQFSVSPRNLY